MIIPGLYNYCYIKYITIHELINLKISGKGHGVCKHWQVKVIGSGKQGAHCGRTDLAILKTNSKQQRVVGNLWHVFSVHKIFPKIFQKMEARGWSGTSVLRARRFLGSNYPPKIAPSESFKNFRLRHFEGQPGYDVFAGPVDVSASVAAWLSDKQLTDLSIQMLGVLQEDVWYIWCLLNLIVLGIQHFGWSK